MTREGPRAFDSVAELGLNCVFEGDDLAEVFEFTFWWQDPDVHPLLQCCSLWFDVFLEMFLFSWGFVVGHALLWLW